MTKHTCRPQRVLIALIVAVAFVCNSSCWAKHVGMRHIGDTTNLPESTKPADSDTERRHAPPGSRTILRARPGCRGFSHRVGTVSTVPPIAGHGSYPESGAMKQAAIDLRVRAQAPETIDHEFRIVWVLAESRSMSEVGPVTGLPEVVIYEVECTRGRLVAAKRTYQTHPAYGLRTWVVQLNQPIMSAEGAKALEIALEGVCQSQRE